MEKMKITICFTDGDGNITSEVSSESEVPSLKEFNKLGFEAAFNQLETVILEERKNTTERAVEGYVSEISKKKLMK